MGSQGDSQGEETAAGGTRQKLVFCSGGQSFSVETGRERTMKSKSIALYTAARGLRIPTKQEK